MKKFFSLFIALTAVFCLSAKELFLNPSWGSDTWNKDGARFAIYAFNDSENVWYDLEAVAEEDGIFSATIDDKYPKVIFCRMNGSKPENNWDNKWNQTQDMTIEAEKDQCNITDWNAGVWAKHGEVVIPAKFYITGSEGLVGDKAWKPNALKVTEDSYTFEGLAAGAYQLKVTEDGSWDTAKGIESMSEVAAGLYRDQDANICFILAAAGNVKVTYKKDESTEFTLEGAFVAPEMKLIGSFAGEWTGETEPIVMEIAADKKSASKTLNLAGEWYDFKVIRGTERLGKENEGTENYKIHRDHNWVDGLKKDTKEVEQKAISLQPDVKGDYTFTYDFAAGKLTVSFPDPVLANGYYLIGKIGGVVPADWNYDALKAEHLFEANTSAEGEEYALKVTLAEGDEFKVVRCDYDKLGTWYPADLDKNYKVDANHAGKATVYFRPNGDGGEGWHEGVIYVTDNGGSTAVDNTEATVKSVKTLENGMLIIEKNGVRYNVLGQSIR